MSNSDKVGLIVLSSILGVIIFALCTFFWWLFMINDPWQSKKGVAWWRIVIVPVNPLAWVGILLWHAGRSSFHFVRENRRRLRQPAAAVPMKDGVYR